MRKGHPYLVKFFSLWKASRQQEGKDYLFPLSQISLGNKQNEVRGKLTRKDVIYVTHAVA